VFNDRIQDAQQSIKASLSANADESLTSPENIENKDSAKDEAKRKGTFSVFFLNLIFIISFCALMLLIGLHNCIGHLACKSQLQ